MADWVELRVHGVSGTPPEDMLASAHVVQVAGDDRTRCFRPADPQGRELRGTDGQLLEAFHWGRWTSGSWMQALWLLLMPFGLVNASQFMLPPPEAGTGARAAASRYAHATCGAVLRLVALVLTVLFSVAAAVVVVDLVVWQWLARRQLPVDDRLLVIGGLLVAAGIGYGLSLLGRTRQGPAYRFRASGQERTDADGLPGLHSAAFFDGDPDAPVLRTLHRAAGLPVVSWAGLSIAASSRGAWSTWAVWIPPVLLGLDRPGDRPARRPRADDERRAAERRPGAAAPLVARRRPRGRGPDARRRRRDGGPAPAGAVGRRPPALGDGGGHRPAGGPARAAGADRRVPPAPTARPRSWASSAPPRCCCSCCACSC